MQNFMKRLSAITGNPTQLLLFLLLYLLILFFDITTPLGYAEWLLYLLPIAGFFQITRFEAGLLTVLATVFIITGFFLSDQGFMSSHIPIFNRSLMLAVLWIVYFLKRRYIRLERDLLAQNLRLESFLNNIGDAIIIFDKKGKIIKMNGKAKVQYPLTKEGAPLATAHDGVECYDMKYNRVPRENLPAFRAIRGEEVRQEKLMLKSNEWKDAYTYIEANSSPIYVNGRLESVIINHHDITHLVEMQNKIKEQQDRIILLQNKRNDELEKNLELKDQFLSLITHELKTPLTVINSAVQTMEVVCAEALSEKGKSYLNKIRQNSNRQLKLVENILDNTKLTEGHFIINSANIDVVSLTRSIVDTAATFAGQKNLRILFHSDLSSRIISLDWEKYERILLNLLSNAVKFTPPEKKITVRLYQRESMICVEVSDEGIGIPENRKSLIFSRFGQANSTLSRNAEGTGIGLSLVKLLVERMDGRIGFESEEGRGSTFTLSLPDRMGESSRVEQTVSESAASQLILKASIEFSDIYF